VRASFARQAFMDTNGAKLASLQPGICEIELPYRADLCQQHGFLHAGVTTTIADSAGVLCGLLADAAEVLGLDRGIQGQSHGAGGRRAFYRAAT